MDVIVMPQLGETVTEGTITAWAVGVGDRVEIDQTLFEVSTEKVDTEVPAARAGHVRAILVAEGATVPIGTPVAVTTPNADDPFDPAAIGDPSAMVTAADGVARGHDPGDAPPDQAGPGAVPPGASSSADPPGDSPPVASRPVDPTRVEPAASGAAAATPGTAPPLSPVVRRLLHEHGLDPEQVVGTGRNGRITRSDVVAASAQADRAPAAVASGPAAADRPDPDPQVTRSRSPQRAADPHEAPVGVGEHDEVIEFSRARSVTADHLRSSLDTAAHALVVVEVDYHAIEPVRRAAGLSYLPFVARAVVEAVREHPHMNATVHGERLVVRRRVRLGVAVDVDQEALVVPVLHHADQLRLPALAAAVSDLADRARRRRLTAEELEGGTFTLTNVGSSGTVIAAPIIHRPQVAVLSTDGVRMKPVAVRTDPHGAPGAEWGVAVHPVGNLSMSFDHRAVDGAYAASFLAQVRHELETRAWVEEL